jgi:NADH:ubiquinone oxidoreductase subunit E
MLPSHAYCRPAPGAVLAALHEITARCGCLLEDELRRAAAELGVPMSQRVSAASFYAPRSASGRAAATSLTCAKARPATSRARRN